jgi:hypothetical protein
MTRSDRLFSRVVLGTIAPVVLMLTGWWGALGVLGDEHPAIGPAALGGLALGVVLDLTVLRTHLDSVFDLGLTALSVIALFYSIMIFGFFMGFPLFLLLVGFGGGHVVGRSAAIHRFTAEWTVRERRRVAAVATLMLAALCVWSACLALNEPTIGWQLQQMLGLPFEVTDPMIYATIVVGGAGLLAVQYGTTILEARRASRIA